MALRGLETSISPTCARSGGLPMSRRPQSAEDLALRTFIDVAGRKVVEEVASRTLGKTPDEILAEIEKLPPTKEQKGLSR